MTIADSATNTLVRIGLGNIAFAPIGTALWIATSKMNMKVHEDYDVTRNSLDTFIVFSLLSAMGALHGLFFFHDVPQNIWIRGLSIVLFAGFMVGMKELIGQRSERPTLQHKNVQEWFVDFLTFASTAVLMDVGWWVFHRNNIATVSSGQIAAEMERRTKLNKKQMENISKQLSDTQNFGERLSTQSEVDADLMSNAGLDDDALSTLSF